MAFKLVPAEFLLSGKLTGKYTLSGPYMQSPDYVAGVSGWAIFGDGSVELNNGTFRGTLQAAEFIGSDFVMTPAGLFYYSGTPGLGNLTCAIIPQGTTEDPYGNPVSGSGFQVYGTGGQSIQISEDPDQVARVKFFSGRSQESQEAEILQFVFNENDPTETIALQMAGPAITGYPDFAWVDFQSSTKDGTSGYAGGNLIYTDRSGTEHIQLEWGESGLIIPQPWNYVGAAGQPAFGAGWSNRGGSFVALAFKKLADNSVEIRGWCTPAATSDTTLFTLPSGYQPASEQSFIGWAVTGSAPGQWNVGTNGAVSYASAALPNTGNYYIDAVISLDQ